MAEKSKEVQDLIEHNDELENYFRNTIIPQLYIDGALTLRKYTPPAMRQFKLSEGDIGKTIGDLKDNLRFPTIAENIQHVIDSKEILEKEIQTTDMRWYQMNIIPYVKMKDNRTDGVIITFVEITGRIRDLKTQEKLIAEHAIILDTISHDLNNPLANLMSAVELLKSVSQEDKEKFTAFLKIVDNALMKMKKLINELTESRMEEFEGNTTEELLDFEHILEDVRLSLGDNFIASNASLSSEIKVSEISFSRRKLRTVMYNLINNAIKFKSSQRELKIHVATYSEKDYFVISVQDNGIGIAENKMNSIFLKYNRLDHDMEGSGIGLYLVNEIVTHAGGKIEVKSQEGEGTEFKVFLKME